MAEMPRITADNFRGLNNVDDPIHLGKRWRGKSSEVWMTRADNVIVTAKGELQRAEGYSRVTTNTSVTGAYVTADFKRFYLVDQGEIREMHDDWTYTVRKSGLSSAPVRFAEANGDVFYSNGRDYGVLEADGWRAWGIEPPPAPDVSLVSGELAPGYYRVCCTLMDARGMESGASEHTMVTVAEGEALAVVVAAPPTGYRVNVYVTEANGTVFQLLAEDVDLAVSYTGGPTTLGRELPYPTADAPRGLYPAFFGGRAHLGEAFPELDQSVIWRSFPLQYHHFDHGSEALAVPGTLLMQAETAGALIVGTERQIFAWNGERLDELAPYGVVPGVHAARRGDKLYFWSTRGLCQAMPFVNLTENTVSVAPGLSAAGAVLEKDGFERYVVALHEGGSAFNAR